MQTIQVLTPRGLTQALYDLADADVDGASVRSETATRIVLDAELGSHAGTAIISGRGFTYDRYGLPTAGTVTGLRIDLDGAGIVGLSGLALSVSDLRTAVVTGRVPSLDGPWIMKGNVGGDILTGLGGGDRISGNDGNDTLSGAGGNDRLDGGRGNDRVSGDAGNDILHGGSGNDRLSDLSGNNSLFGDAGNDQLVAGSGRDVLSGGAGHDRLTGGGGADRLSGNAGNDVLIGGTGRDDLRGGAGADRFVFTSAADSPSRASADRILDFSHAAGDRIDLSALDSGRLTFRGSGVFTDDDQVRVTGSGHHWTVSVNLDADRAAEMVFTVESASRLVASDFLL